jgi:primosomal protein N' (replication factor Y)
MSELLADVAVDAYIGGTDPIFTYRVPAMLRAEIQPGRLVWAPLRRQRVQGVVLDVYPWVAPTLPDGEAPPLLELRSFRELIDLADPEVLLTPAQLHLARWVASTYRAPLYESLALMLPPGVTQESEVTWRPSSGGMQIDLGGLPERERAILYFLRQHGETSEQDLRGVLRGSDTDLRAAYTTLMERGLLLRGTRITRPRARPRIERYVRLLAIGADLDQAFTALQRSPKQRVVLEAVAAHAPTGEAIPAKVIYQAAEASLTLLQSLEKRGFVALEGREVLRDPLAVIDIPADTPPTLTSAQERVWRPIAAALDRLRAADQIAPHFLLHGVTGSGKTEIYLRAIGRAMRMGRQALVIVPEIALTTQLVRRFAARFPGALAVLHSGLSAGERYDEWRRLRRGDAWVAIGSRSAVFAPLPELGLIIVDEEHETTFKHDGSPRYHARAAARRLAELANIPIILGSATPSIESYAETQHTELAGTPPLQLLELLERVSLGRDANGLPRSEPLPLPPVTIVDMRRELQSGNRSIFSRPLQAALGAVLDQHEQAILFLNRRGAAAFVMCRECGHVVSCPNCSNPLTLHYDGVDDESDGPPMIAARNRSEILVCHGCGHRELTPAICPSCWSPRIKSFGIGTQRVVEEVRALFPEARVLRWDKDTVTRKGDHARMLDRFLNHEADVLIGTQMIAKGLDLPLVSLVGVVAADTGLYLPDFRAGERAFQLLTQVAGRAGRRSAGAKVVIQTYTPDHYALRAAQEHDYVAFYQQEIAFRRATSYPPYARLVRFVYAGGSADAARRVAEELAKQVEAVAATIGLSGWSMVGPAPAFFERVRNRFRWHLMVRLEDPQILLRHLRVGQGWLVDVDPVHVL